jgi:hypothetical protein
MITQILRKLQNGINLENIKFLSLLIFLHYLKYFSLFNFIFFTIFSFALSMEPYNFTIDPTIKDPLLIKLMESQDTRLLEALEKAIFYDYEEDILFNQTLIDSYLTNDEFYNWYEQISNVRDALGFKKENPTIVMPGRNGVMHDFIDQISNASKASVRHPDMNSYISSMEPHSYSNWKPKLSTVLTFSIAIGIVCLQFWF